jgi:endoglucanase
MKTLRFMVAVVVVASSPCALGCGAGSSDVVSGPQDAGPPEAASLQPNGDDEMGAPVGPVGPEMTGLHVVGNSIENAQGQMVVMHGVNRSGTEYKCVQTGGGIFDGPASEVSVQAIASWKANAVRIPLNESCWLAINGAPTAFAGDTYKSAIRDYVALLHKYHIIPILELHWVGPGTLLATSPQQPMPDLDHAPAFWSDVTATFSADDGVIFEPYNEPYPGMNRDTTAAWTCWQQGCTTNLVVPTGAPAVTYTAVGMQGLVDAIRQTEQASAGPTHVILAGGIQFSNDLSQWIDYMPTDRAGNLGAAWHVYSTNSCHNATCYDMGPASVAALVPLVATEIGESDCGDTFISPLMQWLDSKTSSYLAWSWDAYGPCPPPDAGNRGSPWSLITDYTSGTPNSTFAQTYHDHIVGF